MIKINVNKDKIIFKGHALYDDKGKDIVCSAVSSIMITSINGINSLRENSLSINNDKDEFIIKINKHDEIIDGLIINMIDLLKELEIDYPKNIEIKGEYND